MRPLSRSVLALAVAGLVVTLGAPPSSAATDLNPAKLPRGADVAVPHLEGRSVVDGAVRFDVESSGPVRLLGKVGDQYVVGTSRSDGSRGRIVRLAADGTTTARLGRGDIWSAELSDDRATVSTSRFTDRRTVVKVRGVDTAARVAKREFRGYVSVLDADGGRLLLGRDGKATVWTLATDAVSTVEDRTGYAGDLSSDVLAVYTKDPFEGGCTVLQRLSSGARLWKSCDERVTALNADASRMATIDILSDGLGPAYVAVRTASGQELASYEVDGWFGEIAFETPTSLLLETNGRRKAATVRCTDAGCERASGLSRTRFPRAAA